MCCDGTTVGHEQGIKARIGRRKERALKSVHAPHHSRAKEMMNEGRSWTV